MTEQRFALPLPDRVAAAPEDERTIEVARVWISRGHPEIVVRPAFDDPRDMGAMLAEVCWNFAHAYAMRSGVTEAEALQALRQGWIEGHARGDENAKQRGAQ